MPYHIGEKGSNGCSGYPVVDDKGKAVGCHPTRAKAVNHMQALYANVPDASKADTPMDVSYNAVVTDPTPANPSNHLNPSVGIRKPQILNYGRQVGPGIHDKRVVEIMHIPFLGKFDNTKQEMGSYETPIPSPLESEQEIKQCEYDGCGCPTCKEMNVCCDLCPVCQANEMKSDCCPDLNKQSPCWEGYVQRGMKPGKNGKMVPNCVPAQKADDLWEDSDDVVYETDSVIKADGYSPPAGARAAARKAIKFKEDGKAGGAGTSVGWTRAHQLANGETLSLSTVKRMYSYFSRHEVDKKGKDWGSQSNPSNGYIMWLAWGGDAGYSWSRRIVNAEKDKKMFSNIFSVIDKTNKNTRGSGNVFWSI